MIGGKVVEHNLYRKKLETKTFDYFDDNDYDRGARVNAERIYNVDAVGASPDDITNTNISVISNSKNKSDEDTWFEPKKHQTKENLPYLEDNQSFLNYQKV